MSEKLKAYKVVLYIIDHDRIGAAEIKDVLESVKYPNHCIAPEVAEIEAFGIGEWHDEHPLNQNGVDTAGWLAEFGEATDGEAE